MPLPRTPVQRRVRNLAYLSSRVSMRISLSLTLVQIYIRTFVLTYLPQQSFDLESASKHIELSVRLFRSTPPNRQK